MDIIGTDDIESAIHDQISADREQFQQYLFESAGLDIAKLKTIKTFEQVGVMTRDKGLVLKFEDGSEFDVCITQRKRPRA